MNFAEILASFHNAMHVARIHHLYSLDSFGASAHDAAMIWLPANNRDQHCTQQRRKIEVTQDLDQTDWRPTCTRRMRQLMTTNSLGMLARNHVRSLHSIPVGGVVNPTVGGCAARATAESWNKECKAAG